MAYLSDTFSEELDSFYARLVHLVTGIGFILMSFRILTMKFKKFRVQPRNENSISSNYFEPENYSKKLFYVVLFLSVFEILFFGPTLYSYLNGKKVYTYFNWNLIIFSILLPFFSIAIEYSLNLLLQTNKDIYELMGYKYNYKKI